MCKTVFITFVLRQYPPSAILDLRRKLLNILSYRRLNRLPTACAWNLWLKDQPQRPGGRGISGEGLLIKLSLKNRASPKNIASPRLTAPGSPRLLKDWPEMSVIFRLQPNRPGIKLRVGDDWHFRLLKHYYKTINEIRDRERGGRTIALALFCLG